MSQLSVSCVFTFVAKMQIRFKDKSIAHASSSSSPCLLLLLFLQENVAAAATENVTEICQLAASA